MSKYISTSFYLILGVLIAGVFMWGNDSLAVGTINITKETDPSGFQNFDFTINDSPFMLDDGETQPFIDQPAGTYTVIETDAASGFELTDISCIASGGSTAMVDLDNNQVEIDLMDDTTVNCTFTNTGTSTIIIEKETVPADGMDFDFTSDIPDSEEFTLDDGDDIEVNVPPDMYEVVEATKPGYVLSDIVCDDMGSVTDVDTRTAMVDADAGETVTCTFTNTQIVEGINLVKTGSPDPVVAGDELTYQIIVDHQGDIAATNVVVTDTLPPDVTLVSVNDDDPDTTCMSTDSVSVECDIGTLSVDETVTITIVVIPDPDVYTDAPEVIDNVATLTAEPGPVEVESTAMTEVNPIVDLDITSNDDERSVGRGNTFDVEYEISVSEAQVAALKQLRQSSLTPVQKADALGVILQISYLANFEVVDVVPSQGSCDTSIQCLLGDIIEGQTVLVVVTFRAPDERGDYNINALVETLAQTFNNVVVIRVRDKNNGCSIAPAAASMSFPLYLLIPILIPIRRFWKRIYDRDRK